MIGSNIRRIRLEKNITQEDLGKSAKVGRATINRYESGIITNIPYDRILRIASALDVTPSKLLGWENEHSHLESLIGSELAEKIALRTDDELFLQALEVLTSMNQEELTILVSHFDRK